MSNMFMKRELTYQLNKRSSSSHSHLSHGVFRHLCPVLRFLQFLLSFSKLGQVQSSNFFSFFDLQLVSFDLLLKLIRQFGHPLLILPVLILRKHKFLDLPLRSMIGLDTLTGVGLGVAQLHLQLPDPHLQLGHGSLPIPDSSVLDISQPSLHLCHLTLQTLPVPQLSVGVILLSSEFISKSGGVNQGTFGFLLTVLGSLEERVNLCLASVQGSLQSSLGSHFLAVYVLHLINLVSGIAQINIQLPLRSLSCIKKCSTFIHFSSQSRSFS